MSPLRVRRVFLLGAVVMLSLLAVAYQYQMLQASSPTASSTGAAPCIDGLADGFYPCRNVDMLAHLTIEEIGGSITGTNPAKGNDHWGWTDPATGRQFVIFGLRDGTSFIEITDPENPVYLGKLPAHNPGDYSIWADVKVYEHYAYIVIDQFSNNGLQIFDLTQLTTVNAPPVTFTETAHYAGFDFAHNLWVDEETGYLYVMRTNLCPTVTILNINDPLNPVSEGPDDNGVPGCFVDEPGDEIVSDAECLVYSGPDVDYTGHELCFIASDKTLSIADVTSKTNPIVITNTLVYTDQAEVARLHQGALTRDQRYWLVSDVWDERDYGHNTRTYVWDVADLDSAKYLGFYEHDSTARDHNLYFVGNTVFQANWRSGLRILEVSHLPSRDWILMGYFDIVPDNDSVADTGAWSNYPYWGNGIVTVSGTDEGLFVLQFRRDGYSYIPLVFNN